MEVFFSLSIIYNSLLFGLSWWYYAVCNWLYATTINILGILGDYSPEEIWLLFQGNLLLFIYFISAKSVSIKYISFGGQRKITFIQGVPRYKINLNNIFVKIKIIPILLLYINISRSQCCNICAWFGNYLAVISFLFCIVSSSIIFSLFFLML